MCESGAKRWFWDLYPLAKDSWGAWYIEPNDERPDHRVYLYRRSLDGYQSPVAPVATLFDEDARSQAAGGAVPNNIIHREGYAPSEEDFSLLTRCYPGKDAHKPEWLIVKKDLVCAGHERVLLDTADAPLLLGLLAKAKVKPYPTGGTQSVPRKVSSARSETTVSSRMAPSAGGSASSRPPMLSERVRSVLRDITDLTAAAQTWMCMPQEDILLTVGPWYRDVHLRQIEECEKNRQIAIEAGISLAKALEGYGEGAVAARGLTDSMERKDFAQARKDWAIAKQLIDDSYEMLMCRDFIETQRARHASAAVTREDQKSPRRKRKAIASSEGTMGNEQRERPDRSSLDLCAQLREESAELDVSPPPVDDPVPRQHAWMEVTAALLADVYGQRLRRAASFREHLVNVKHASRSRSLGPDEKREHRRMAKGLFEVLVLAEQAVSAADRWRCDLWDRTKILLPAVAKGLVVVCSGTGHFDCNRLDEAVVEWRRIEVAAAEKRASAGEPRRDLSPRIFNAEERAAWRVPKQQGVLADPDAGLAMDRGERRSVLPPSRKGGYDLFYSFSTKDDALRERLETHLAILRREHLIREWHCRKIPPGGVLKDEIDNHLNTASIILLLVSADFLDSDYCYTIEMERAMERHKERRAVVIPIILRPCDWHGAPFGGLKALPKDGKPVVTWDNEDEAFTDIAKGIRALIAGPGA